MKYLNYGGNSSVVAYEIYADSIAVQFKDGRWYTYSYASAGIDNVERMKQLARNGQGLCSFIQHKVKFKYTR